MLLAIEQFRPVNASFSKKKVHPTPASILYAAFGWRNPASGYTYPIEVSSITATQMSTSQDPVLYTARGV